MSIAMLSVMVISTAMVTITVVMMRKLITVILVTMLVVGIVTKGTLMIMVMSRTILMVTVSTIILMITVPQRKTLSLDHIVITTYNFILIIIY